MKRLLLHICCAPCGAGCVLHPFLKERDLQIAELYFSNSNLDSPEEYEKRLKYVRQLGEFSGLPVSADPYDHDAWLRAVAGYENEPEGGARCRRCFRFNLSRAAERAQLQGVAFATTLTVSPRKNSAVIFAEGENFPGFEALDFKKKEGYLNGTRLARQQNFYRQNYCGCEFSKKKEGSGS